MSVVQTSVSRVNPGRSQDVPALALEAAKLFERHGSGESRLLVAGLAGEATGTYVFTTEFANGEAWGAWSDGLNADPETQALLDRVNSDDEPDRAREHELRGRHPARASERSRGVVT